MGYFFCKDVDGSLDDVVTRVTGGLMDKGFGVLTTIDVSATLHAKLGVDFRPYVILGACNPKLAHRALTTEPNIGVMLPCNVVVQAVEGGGTRVCAVDPVASMQAVDNPELAETAAQVQALLREVVEGL